ncbi:MAG: Ig domain protein group 1 domain protein [Gemmatimonadetes bacterium]|nr:Ig domain protein group 1 domain protein [Gemmatimonadota bacterium]
MRSALRLAGLFVLALGVVTCADSTTSLPSHGRARVALTPNFSREASSAWNNLASFSMAVNNAHVVLRDLNGKVLKDVVVPMNEGEDILLELYVDLDAPTEELAAQIDLRQGEQVLFSGTQSVSAVAGIYPTLTPPPAVIILYVGPGATATKVAISPRDPVLGALQTLSFSARVTNSAGTEQTGTPITWSSTNPLAGSINAAGMFTSASASAVTQVIARTPTGLADTTTLTVKLGPAKVVVISGNNQTLIGGGALASAVEVEVRTADDKPVAGVPVTFSAVGAGLITSGATSDANGRARANISQLPGKVGTYTFTAAGAGLAPATITATVLASAASKVQLVSGNNQQDTVGKLLALPFVVKVTDAFDNPVTGFQVQWRNIDAGGGKLTGSQSATDASGLASMTYTLSTSAHLDSVVADIGAPGTPVLFNARSITKTDGVPAKLALVAGNNQTDTVSKTIAPFIVKVTDVSGKVVAGATVNWKLVGGATGTLAAATSLTDANGQAQVTYKFGAIARTDSVEATLPGVSGQSVTFIAKSVTKTDGVAAILTLVSGNGQQDTTGNKLALPFIVKVTDVSGRAVTTGATVRWTLKGGAGGTLSASSSLPDANGQAQVSYTLGAAARTDTVEATLVGVSGPLVQFITTVVARPPGPNTIAKVSGDGQKAVVGTTLPNDFVVRVTNAAGTPQAGVTVNWTKQGVNTGALRSSTSVTDASGNASVSYTLGNTPQVESVLASLSGTTNAAVSFSAEALVGAAASIRKVSGDNQTTAAGKPTPAALIVQVLDAKGNAVPNSSVNWTSIINGQRSAPSTLQTDASGFSSVTYTPSSTAAARVEQVEAALSANTSQSVLFTVNVTATSVMSAGSKVVTGGSFTVVRTAVPKPPRQ